MKKLIYVFALGMVLSFGFSACTTQDDVLEEMEKPLLEAEGTDGDDETEGGPGNN